MSANPNTCFLVQSGRHLILTTPGIALPVNNTVSIPAPNNMMTACNMFGPNGQFYLVHRHANRDCRPARVMPRDGAIVFGDLIGKLDMLRVSCEKCGRDGRYGLAKLIDKCGRDGKLPTGAS